MKRLLFLIFILIYSPHVRAQCANYSVMDNSAGTAGNVPANADVLSGTHGQVGSPTALVSSGITSSMITYTVEAHTPWNGQPPTFCGGGSYLDNSSLGLSYVPGSMAGTGVNGTIALCFQNVGGCSGSFTGITVGNTVLASADLWTTLPQTAGLNCDCFTIFGSGSGTGDPYANEIFNATGSEIRLVLEGGTCTGTDLVVPTSPSGAVTDSSQRRIVHPTLQYQANGQHVLILYDANWVQIGGTCTATTSGLGTAYSVDTGDAIGNSDTCTASGGSGSCSGYVINYDKVIVCYNNCTSTYPLREVPSFLADGVITRPRDTDWTQAGVQGGIPSASWSQCVNTNCATVTSAGTSATAAQITAALATAPTNTYVLLAAGTYPISTGQISYPLTGHVELRGAGSGAHFNPSGSAGAACVSGTAFICGGSQGGVDISTTTGAVTWTNYFAPGSNQILLSSASGISVGSGLALSQCDTGLNTGNSCSSGTVADNGNAWICSLEYIAVTQTNGCISPSGPGNGVPNRSQMEIHTACAVNGNLVTLCQPLIFPNWVPGQNPIEVTFSTTADIGLNNVYVESPTDAIARGVEFWHVSNWWMKNWDVTDQNAELTWAFNCGGCVNGELQSYYVYKISGNGNPYGVRCTFCTDSLFDNGIVQQTGTPYSFDGPSAGNVIAYNFCTLANDYGLPPSNNMGTCFNEHALNMFDLYDGNIANALTPDGVHDTSNFLTGFRNLFTGWDSYPTDPKSNATNAHYDASFDRYMNYIAEVDGSAIYHTTYTVTNCTGVNSAVFAIGVACAYSIPNDSLSAASLLRWGNYDVVNAAVRFQSGEVPTGASTYPNSLPTVGNTGASQPNFPASFYYTSKPSWWNTEPWPAIGPDISSGNVGVCTGTINTGGEFAGVAVKTTGQCTGTAKATGWAGHVNAIPAMDCAFDLGMPPDGSGGVLAFNPNTCYSGTTINPTIYSFGSVNLGSSSSLETFTLTNSSSVLVTGITVTNVGGATGDFVNTGVGTCGSSLAANSSCSIIYKFTPLAAGSRATTLNVSDSDPSSPQQASLTGTGVALASTPSSPCIAGCFMTWDGSNRSNVTGNSQ